MTNEEKELLLRDLCTRLPYGVICQFIWTYCNETTPAEGVIAKENDNIKGINLHIEEIQADYYDEWVDLEHCKPYLRPMSSMTEEEKEELKREFCIDIREEDNGLHTETYGYITIYHNFNGESWYIPFEAIDWLNKHHFDYRGLIQMGLALEATEGMYV